jgi:hypothetical protein
MMKRLFISAIIILTIESYLFTQEVWTIGPMLHYNIGKDKNHLSIGVEVAYWNLNHFIHSVDFCLEYGGKRIYTYSEVQTGVGIAGLSCGPLLQYRLDEKKLKGGFQFSLWADYFWGFDLRFRWTGKNFYFSPGTFVKVPFTTTGMGDSDEYHSDLWDFDWD